MLNNNLIVVKLSVSKDHAPLIKKTLTKSITDLLRKCNVALTVDVILCIYVSMDFS